MSFGSRNNRYRNSRGRSTTGQSSASRNSYRGRNTLQSRGSTTSRTGSRRGKKSPVFAIAAVAALAIVLIVVLLHFKLGGKEADYSPDFAFTATDLNGNTMTEACFGEAKLTMINFWEPWCGPCVRELPDLQALYNDYYAKGFRIIGVYSTEGMDAEVKSTLSQAGVTYPVIYYQPVFDAFQTGYVPTTIFVNSEGHVVWGPTSGSNSYEGWETIMLQLLN